MPSLEERAQRTSCRNVWKNWFSIYSFGQSGLNLLGSSLVVVPEKTPREDEFALLFVIVLNPLGLGKWTGSLEL